MVEVVAATSVASALSCSLSAMGGHLGVSGAVTRLRSLVTLKIGRSQQGFPPASHQGLCDIQSAVAVTAMEIRS
jgi:hypothetical protein